MSFAACIATARLLEGVEVLSQIERDLEEIASPPSARNGAAWPEARPVRLLPTSLWTSITTMDRILDMASLLWKTMRHPRNQGTLLPHVHGGS
jgi:hypothetical protein